MELSQDSEQNADIPVSGSCTTALIVSGLAVLWLGLAMLAYSVYAGNAPLLFTLGNITYPIGAILTATGTFKLSKTRVQSRSIRIGLTVLGTALTVWGVIALILAAYSIFPVSSLQLF